MYKNVVTFIIVSVALAFTVTNFCYAQAPSFFYSGSPYVYKTGVPINPLVPNNSGGSVTAAYYGLTTTFAGNGTPTYADGIGKAAGLPNPIGIAFDKDKNLYVTSWKLNHIPYIYNYIRKITPSGEVTTVAGVGDQGYKNGPANQSAFSVPMGTAVDASGNVFVADVNNNVIRKITPTGEVSTFAGTGINGTDDGQLLQASFSAPNSITIDGAGNIYVADYSSKSIRKIGRDGLVATLAGPAKGLKGPAAMVFQNSSATLFVADAGGQVISTVRDLGDGKSAVGTLAGTGILGFKNGPAANAQFARPAAVAVDLGGNLYVADAGNNMIRRISAGGEVTTLAGSQAMGANDGVGEAASFNSPEGLLLDNDGTLYVADKGNNLIRKISTSGYTISPALPAGLNFDVTSATISGTPKVPSPATVYTISAYNSYGSTSTKITITVTGDEIQQTRPPAISYETPQVYKVNLTITPLLPKNTGGAVPGQLYGGVSIFAGSGAPGSVDNTGSLASFGSPDGSATDAEGNIYIADAGNNKIRKITPAGVVTTLAGNGTAGASNGSGLSASFNRPAGLTVDRQGNIYVADRGNNAIRLIDRNGQVSTFASGLNNPADVAVDDFGNVYVADAGSNKIKKVTPQGVVSVFAGSGASGPINGVGTEAGFQQPSGIAIDSYGYLYVSDSGNRLIRKITPGGLVSTLAGSGGQGSADGLGEAASFRNPLGIELDGIGNIYISDNGNNTIRKITPGGLVSTLAGNPAQTGRANGQGIDATFNSPRGVAIDKEGNLYVADLVNNLVRKIETNGYTINKPLPDGLTFDGKTGRISGTPNVSSPATDYLITAYNGGGASSFVVNITVQAPAIVKVPPPVISYVTPQNYVINKAILKLEPANSGGAVPATVYGQVSTFTGSGLPGSADGSAASAKFSALHAVATDYVGNVYFADNNLIRKVAPNGVVTTLAGGTAAGSADGQGSAARFNNPLGLAVDIDGNIFVADTRNHTIRMVTQAGKVTTVAGTAGIAGSFNGTGSIAKFNNPTGITIDQDNNIYVADAGNNLIRKLNKAGEVVGLAGSGTVGFANGWGTAASFNNPVGITADLDGNLYVADYGNQAIRKIKPDGVVSTMAGSGQPGADNGNTSAATFNDPASVSADIAGNVYVADAGNNMVRKITPGGVVTTLAGSGAAGVDNGTLSVATFNNPLGVSVDIFGNVYVADFNNNRARKIITTGYSISPQLPAGLVFDYTTGAITGTPTELSPETTYTIVAYNTGGSHSTRIVIAVTEKQVPNVQPPNIRYDDKPTFTTYEPIKPMVPINTGGPLPNKIFGKTTTLAGSGTPGSANGTGTGASFNQPFAVATDKNGNVYVVDHLNNVIRKITPAGVVSIFAGSGAIGFNDGPAAQASFNSPTGITTDVAGNIYVADISNNLIRKITPDGMVTTLAGNRAGGFADGSGNSALFNNPAGLAVDKAGNIYVADQSNNRIRRISPGGVVTTIGGDGLNGFADGPALQARFSNPYSVAVDDDGNVYVADQGNNRIRKISTDGMVTTLAGNGSIGAADGVGTDASFSGPFGLTVDPDGIIYVADTHNELIRRVTPTGYVTTVAGNGKRGNDDGIGSESSFYQPTGIIADAAGNVYIADEFNHTIRQIVVVSNFTIDKPLPKGLNFDPTTGKISGTPTEKSSETEYTVTAYNKGGSSKFTIKIIVNDAPLRPQTITFNALPPKVYGDASFDVTAQSTNSTIPVTYTSSDPKIAVITSQNGVSKIRITGAGRATITASQAGNATYKQADDKTQELLVTPAALVITADDKVKTYMSPNPLFTVTYNGFVYTDGPAQLIARPVVVTDADATSPLGEYDLIASGAASDNYTFTYVPGKLIIKPVPPTVAIPNTFTPNGDGINDKWEINALDSYQNASVSVFDRYGALVFQSLGYPQAWDGTYRGKSLPSGTYYYIIDLKNNTGKLAGSITIIR